MGSLAAATGLSAPTTGCYCVYIFRPFCPAARSSSKEMMRALMGSGRHDSYCTVCGSYDALFTVFAAQTVCTRRMIVRLGM